MDTFSVFAVSFINLFVVLRSSVLIYKNRIQPSLAMWLFFLIAMGISLFTYFKEGCFSFRDNILNIADLFMAGSIVLCILFFGARSTRFNRFEIRYLALVVLILFFWVITQEHFISNLLVQFIMVIAYISTFQRLFLTRKNTESFVLWISMLIASFFALISAKGVLAQIYVWRTIICIIVMLGVMVWIEKKGESFQRGYINKHKI